jgi:hypothetical protein
MSGTITFDDGTTAAAPATLQVPSADDGKGITVVFEDSLLEPEEYPDEKFAILAFADHNTFIPASGQGSQGYSNVVSVSTPGPQTFTWEIKPPARNYYIALGFATRYSTMWYKPDGGPLTTIPINSSGETSAGALSTDDFGYKDKKKLGVRRAFFSGVHLLRLSHCSLFTVLCSLFSVLCYLLSVICYLLSVIFPSSLLSFPPLYTRLPPCRPARCRR